jgi:hypothetical protein
MKKEHRICNTSTDLESIYRFYSDELWLEIYKDWDRSEDDRWVIFILGDILIEYLYRREAGELSGSYLYIEKEEIEGFYNACSSLVNKTTLENTVWWHTQFSVFDPEWFEIKFFRDNNK